MMWLLPAAAAVLAVIPILLMVRRFAREAVELRRELTRFSELRPALLELRSDAQAFRSHVRELGATAPGSRQ